MSDNVQVCGLMDWRTNMADSFSELDTACLTPLTFFREHLKKRNILRVINDTWRRERSYR